MPVVIIDGVEYIPAKDVLANRLEIARGLILDWRGECDNKKADEIINEGYLKVWVNDSGEGISLEETLDNIARVSEQKGVSDE